MAKNRSSEEAKALYDAACKKVLSEKGIAAQMEYSITRYKMTEENLVGMAKAHRRDYDLLDVVMVCLGRKTYKELTGLLSLLNLVLIDNLDSSEKRDRLSKEFNVEITPELEKGVADMCNLSAGIEKRGIEKGIEKGRMKTVINTLRRYIRRQLPIGADVIADIAEDNEMTIEKVRSIAKENGISLS